ncbi:uncharacterized protein DS421_5g144940 [Arachis hypogaea]|nr:uncharacterized protein DS421_5g144940 [Arachis hypogaea]
MKYLFYFVLCLDLFGLVLYQHPGLWCFFFGKSSAYKPLGLVCFTRSLNNKIKLRAALRTTHYIPSSSPSFSIVLFSSFLTGLFFVVDVSSSTYCYGTFSLHLLLLLAARSSSSSSSSSSFLLFLAFSFSFFIYVLFSLFSFFVILDFYYFLTSSSEIVFEEEEAAEDEEEKEKEF